MLEKGYQMIDMVHLLYIYLHRCGMCLNKLLEDAVITLPFNVFAMQFNIDLYVISILFFLHQTFCEPVM